MNATLRMVGAGEPGAGPGTDRSREAGALRIAMTAGSLSRAAGGLFFSVRGLGIELHRRGGEVAVFGVEDECSAEDRGCWSPLEPRLFRARGPRAFRYAPALGAAVLDSGCELLHTHGIWQYPSWVGRAWKARLGRPHVVSPRGMLEDWAWGRSRWKKRPIWWCLERRNLATATVLHATSEQEAEACRRRGLTAPIAVVPNGVGIPPETAPGPESKERRRALFLSRIHPKKGLVHLVQAWAAVRPAGWEMVVCGPDEGGHRAEIEALVRSEGVAGEFRFLPECYGEAKDALLRGADLFVLPTFSENFGIAIAEALAAGIPVITTRGAPWEDLVGRRCGWWVEIGSEPLAAALREATSRPPGELRSMGARGRRLIGEKYSWSGVAEALGRVYAWALGRGPAPECMRFDSRASSRGRSNEAGD